MTDVFISYKREDHARVDRLASLFGELDLTVWHDAALGAGADWRMQIETVARQARCVVVCLTEPALASPWVQSEIAIGLQRGVLVPAKLDECELSEPFSHLHVADLSDWIDGGEHKGLLQLVEGMEQFVGRKLAARCRERAGGQNPEVVSRLRALLIRVARSGQDPISYEQAFASVASYWMDGSKTSFNALYGALDAIADQNRARREPPLFALVVTKEGVPGRGYFQKHCFLSGGTTGEARALHAAHLRRVYQYSWPNDP